MNNSRMKNARTRKRLTQKECALQLNITEASYSFYESGKRKPDPDMLVSIANLLDVSVDFLVGNSPSKEQLENNSDDSELDQLLYSKAKLLSEDDKKTVLNVISAIKKDIDNNELK